MFGRSVTTLALVVVLASCGGDGSGEELSEGVDPTTTSVARGTPPSEPSVVPVQLEILRPGGLGPVDLGDPADQAIAALAELLGPPDAEERIDGGRECVEGSRWPDCVEVADTGRVVTWTTWGLDVLFTDWDGTDAVPVEHRLGSWRATPTTSHVLSTAEGLRPGMSVGDLDDLVAANDFGFAYNEGVIDGAWIVTGDGGYWGWLDWDPATSSNERPDLIRAVQTALNSHGAGLVVDGVWGPRSQAAWEHFLTDQALAPVPSTMWLTPAIGEALGLPTDTFTIATLEPHPDAVEAQTSEGTEPTPPSTPPPAPESSIAA